jgi:hypothetical protein
LREVDEFINQFGEIGWELVTMQGLVPPEIGVVCTKYVILFF